MKKLSIEEKAKRYDEAIERAKDQSSKYCLDKIVIEEIFPELKESEDEKLRKELLNAFQESEDSLYMVLTPNKRESFIAWLEKQGEQKPQIKLVFPKFRVGDIIQHIPLEKWDTTKKITHIDETGYYFNLSHQGDTVSGGFIGFSFENEYELVEQNPAWSEENERNIKVQKIREKVEKLKSNLIYGACSSQVAMETRCKEEAYNDVLGILDTMQKEKC